MAALRVWTAEGLPGDPGAWLYTVAHNQMLGDLRKQGGRSRILENAADGFDGGGIPPATAHFSGEVKDDMLRMLFICCNETIPRESQLVLALKTLCGFSTAEIGFRLFATEANVHKRLARARERLSEGSAELQTPPLETLGNRLSGVLDVLYLLFNEGYLSSHPEQAVRNELCEEAIRLTALLAEHPVGARSETFALLALMHLHTARLPGRMDGAGGLLLLEEQDRSLWDEGRIRIGLEWLARGAVGETFSRFHAEAGIAAEHCLAPSFGETRWKEIVDLYAMLERISPSPLHTLNKAVAMAEWQGAEAGLSVLEGLLPTSRMSGFYLWEAVFSDLNRRAGNIEIARQHQVKALESAPTEALRALLRRRLDL